MFVKIVIYAVVCPVQSCVVFVNVKCKYTVVIDVIVEVSYFLKILNVSDWKHGEL
jgi:hypothetical protein